MAISLRLVPNFDGDLDTTMASPRQTDMGHFREMDMDVNIDREGEAYHSSRQVLEFRMINNIYCLDTVLPNMR